MGGNLMGREEDKGRKGQEKERGRGRKEWEERKGEGEGKGKRIGRKGKRGAKNRRKCKFD